jgi:hypothetical protein
MKDGIDTYDKAIEDIKTRLKGKALEHYINFLRGLERANYPIQQALERICQVTLHGVEAHRKKEGGGI